MGIIALLWLVTLSVVVGWALLDIFAAYCDGCEDWKRIMWIIVLQWLALFTQAAVLSALLLEGDFGC